jgi:hypothetical protein
MPFFSDTRYRGAFPISRRRNDFSRSRALSPIIDQ